MPNLHVHFFNGNVKAFRQELDGTAGGGGAGGQSSGGGGGMGGSKGGIGPSSASGGRSWTMSGIHMAAPIKADPNERDSFGRTVLQLAASSLAPQAYTFFSILLRNPNISVNLQDYESGYTALHRALFAGNIRAARDLLARSDTDISIKDGEGLTAFDLYNGTVDGTNPPTDAVGTDLYVWGVNRNFALGTGDSNDKAFPDRINLLTQNQASDKPDPAQRFFHVGVKDVQMAKLHTAAVTSDHRGNLSLCGFGSGGRLGRSTHSQLSLTPLPDLPHTIISIALGQDHSLALTSGGYILSWGHNRFSQLGYVIDPPDRPTSAFAKDGDELIQSTPKRIVGPLKKEWVRGVAAGRISSACWTADAVWTWGTNAGHLGYEKAAHPVQAVPRKVTALSQPVIDVALSDYAMICLLDSHEVMCFHHDTHFKINFSTPRILSEAYPFQPPQSTLRPMIKKVTSSGQTFAALSTIGDVFTFQLPHPAEDVSKDVRDRHVSVKPQLVWALRKNFTAVKDVALGSDGTVIICTHSGHVFVRQRMKSGGQLKFKRIPYLQRVIKVTCNECGAFGAIRVDAKPTAIELSGKTLEEDMFLLQPHFRRFEHQMTAEDFDKEISPLISIGVSAEDDEDEGSNSVAKDTIIAIQMCTILNRWRATTSDSLFSWSESLLGSDLVLVAGGYSIPAHSVILSLRSPVFQRFLDNGESVPGFSISSSSDIRGKVINVDTCHPLVVLLLLQYLYSDEVAAVWDARVARVLRDKFGPQSQAIEADQLNLNVNEIKMDLKRLADALELGPLSSVLNAASKQPISKRTLARDLETFFNRTSTVMPTSSLGQEVFNAMKSSKSSEGSVIVSDHSSVCDVLLVLADRQVACQSVLLRARCPFFEAMFADQDWTSARARDEAGRVVIHMEHLKWRPMRLVFRFIHQGVEDDLFDYLHQETLDEFLDFVFEVLAASTELLMDRLVLVCSRVIVRHCNVYNAASLACEAAFYQATILKLSVFEYITSCMETMLESGLLDGMDDDVLRELSTAIAKRQVDKLPIPRKGILVAEAMEKHREWLAMQDIPVPRLRVPARWRPRSPALSPADPPYNLAGNGGGGGGTKVRRPPPSPIISPSPDLGGHGSSSNMEDIFAMDDEVPSPSTVPGGSSGGGTGSRSSRPMTPLSLASGGGGPISRSGGGPVWKSKTVEADKIDLRSIMAEASAARKQTTPQQPKIPVTPSISGSIIAYPSSSSTSTNNPVTPARRMSQQVSSSSHPSASPTFTPSRIFGSTPPQQQHHVPGLGPTPGSSSVPPGKSSVSPWRSVEPRKTSLGNVQQQQQQQQQQQGFVASPSNFLNRPAGSQASPVVQRVGSSRIITPTRIQPSGPILGPSAGGPRRNSGPAWSTPAPSSLAYPQIHSNPPTKTFPISTNAHSTPLRTISTPRTSSAFPTLHVPGSVSPNSQAFSLLAIQQEELALAERNNAKRPVKSFTEIQEEEKKANEAREKEKEFMRWWKDEEARVAREKEEKHGGGEKGKSSSSGGGSGGKAGRGRGGAGGGQQPRRWRGRGKGGGGGGERGALGGAQTPQATAAASSHSHA